MPTHSGGKSDICVECNKIFHQGALQNSHPQWWKITHALDAIKHLVLLKLWKYIAWFIEEKSVMIVSNALNLFIDLNIWRRTCWYTLEKSHIFAENVFASSAKIASPSGDLQRQRNKASYLWSVQEVVQLCWRSEEPYSQSHWEKNIFLQNVSIRTLWTMLYFWVAIFFELRPLFGLWKGIQKKSVHSV